MGSGSIRSESMNTDVAGGGGQRPPQHPPFPGWAVARAAPVAADDLGAGGDRRIRSRRWSPESSTTSSSTRPPSIGGDRVDDRGDGLSSLRAGRTTETVRPALAFWSCATVQVGRFQLWSANQVSVVGGQVIPRSGAVAGASPLTGARRWTRSLDRRDHLQHARWADLMDAEHPGPRRLPPVRWPPGSSQAFGQLHTRESPRRNPLLLRAIRTGPSRC